MRYVFAAIVSAVLVSGCGGRQERPARAASVPTDWRRVATAADRDRLRGWRAAWIEANAQITQPADRAAMAAQGALFDPDRTLERPVPPAGDYRCRVFKLGAQSVGGRSFTADPAYACRIDDEGEVSSFHKTGGVQRPVGLIFNEAAGRAVFLGTLLLGDETRPINYGQDASRDMAGYVDRIGERRWRIMLPRPRFESIVDVIEVVPVSSPAL